MSELKISEEKENPLFNRKEIKGFIEAEIVPSRAETLDILSKKFNVPKENIKIKKILGKFGSKTFSVEANIYASEKDKESIELKKKKEKAPEKLAKEATEEKPEQKQLEEQPKPEAAQEPIEEPAQPKTPKDSDKPQENPRPQGEVKEQ